MKKCPFCAELIQDEAIICRYCGSNLTGGAGPKPPSPSLAKPLPPGSRRKTGWYVTGGLLLLVALGRILTAAERAEFKANNPNPTTVLSCGNCPNGIPIYDSWSTTRAIDGYGRNGEQCEVSANYTTSYIKTLQPNAAYTYIDTQPHLYLRCPSGQGFVYTHHTTFR